MTFRACLLCMLALGCATDPRVAESADAVVDPVDAAIVDVGTDASAPVDANVDAGPCPTYTNDVQPIYARHCATCHTSGRDPHFGTSYTIAAQTTSACGRTITLASCTVQLGRPGGTMARNDRLGGFAPDELQTIQRWIACGIPQ